MSLIIIVIVVLAVLLVIFTLQNSIEISLNFFLWNIENVPLILVLIGCVVLGYIIASVYFYPRLWKRKKEYKKLLKMNKNLEFLQEPNPEKEISEEETNPEGMAFDDEKEGEKSSFFDD